MLNPIRLLNNHLEPVVDQVANAKRQQLWAEQKVKEAYERGTSARYDYSQPTVMPATREFNSMVDQIKANNNVQAQYHRDTASQNPGGFWHDMTPGSPTSNQLTGDYLAQIRAQHGELYPGITPNPGLWNS